MNRLIGHCLFAGFAFFAFFPVGACRETSSRREAPPAAVTGQAQWRPLAPGLAELRSQRKDTTGASIVWIVIRVDLTRANVRPQQARDDRLDSLAAIPGAVFAVNAGFFDPGGTPTGLIVQEGRVHHPWRRGGGSGVLMVHGTTATTVAAPPESFDGVSLAVQCGPRLVEPGGVSGIHSDDGKRAARTVACVRNQGHELDFVIAYDPATAMGGPTLFQTAEWLVKPLVAGDFGGCDTALNLDGGPSTGFVAQGIPEAEWRQPVGRVPWGISAARRDR